VGTEVRKFGRRYPWDQWLSRGKVTLVAGKDFNGRADTMAQQVRAAASKRGLSISVTISQDNSTLTVVVKLGGRK
jgi:hypothetical protein